MMSSNYYPEWVSSDQYRNPPPNPGMPLAQPPPNNVSEYVPSSARPQGFNPPPRPPQVHLNPFVRPPQPPNPSERMPPPRHQPNLNERNPQMYAPPPQVQTFQPPRQPAPYDPSVGTRSRVSEYDPGYVAHSQPRGNITEYNPSQTYSQSRISEYQPGREMKPAPYDSNARPAPKTLLPTPPNPVPQEPKPEKPVYVPMADTWRKQKKEGALTKTSGAAPSAKIETADVLSAVLKHEGSAGSDRTIENILKSIGFDFELSRRTQEKAERERLRIEALKRERTDSRDFGIMEGHGGGMTSFIGKEMSEMNLKEVFAAQMKEKIRGEKAEEEEFKRMSAYDRGAEEQHGAFPQRGPPPPPELHQQDRRGFGPVGREQKPFNFSDYAHNFKLDDSAYGKLQEYDEGPQKEMDDRHQERGREVASLEAHRYPSQREEQGYHARGDASEPKGQQAYYANRDRRSERHDERSNYEEAADYNQQRLQQPQFEDTRRVIRIDEGENRHSLEESRYRQERRPWAQQDDRGQERNQDRNQDRNYDRNQDRHQERNQDRGYDRNQERYQGYRNQDRNYDRNQERNEERNQDRNQDRNYERSQDYRYQEQNQDRNYDRNQAYRSQDRYYNRNQDRNYDRTQERNQDRNQDRIQDRNQDRTQGRNQDRPQDRNQDRTQDRNQDRSQDRTQDRNQDRSQDRTQDRSQDRTQDYRKHSSRDSRDHHRDTAHKRRYSPEHDERRSNASERSTEQRGSRSHSRQHSETPSAKMPRLNVSREPEKAAVLDKKEEEHLRQLYLQREERRLRLSSMESQLQTLRNNQNELLRKRNRAGPENERLIRDSNRLQEEIVEAIEELKKTIEANTKKIENALSVSSQDDISLAKGEIERYHDAGNHECLNCLVKMNSVHDHFNHLSSSNHRRNVRLTMNQLWKPLKPENSSKGPTVDVGPAQGAEFIMWTEGFFCDLCKVYLDDRNSGEQHLLGREHNKMYQAFKLVCPSYEKIQELNRESVKIRHRQEEARQRKENEALAAKHPAAAAPPPKPVPEMRVSMNLAPDRGRSSSLKQPQMPAFQEQSNAKRSSSGSGRASGQEAAKSRTVSSSQVAAKPPEVAKPAAVAAASDTQKESASPAAPRPGLLPLSMLRRGPRAHLSQGAKPGGPTPAKEAPPAPMAGSKDSGRPGGGAVMKPAKPGSVPAAVVMTKKPVDENLDMFSDPDVKN